MVSVRRETDHSLLPIVRQTKCARWLPAAPPSGVRAVRCLCLADRGRRLAAAIADEFQVLAYSATTHDVKQPNEESSTKLATTFSTLF